MKGKIRKRYRRRIGKTKLKSGPGQSCKEDPTDNSGRKIQGDTGEDIGIQY